MFVYTALALFCVGFVFLLRGNLLSLVLGFVILGNAVNLLIFVISSPQLGAFPFITKSTDAMQMMSDPLPQAMILTAIVISFAMLCYLIALAKRVIDDFGISSTDELEKESSD